MRSAGFTLIEMLIVVIILGIMASLTYPSYQRYVLQSHRAEAITTLLELANRQEQWLLDRGRYASHLAELGFSSSYSASGRYRIRLSSQSQPLQFNLVMEAVGPQQQDTECLLFSLNHLGQKNHGQPSAASCWR